MAEAPGRGCVDFFGSTTCRYYMHGVCKDGGKCRFKHSLTDSKPSSICKYYMRGTCSYGTNCRYDHIKSKDLKPPPVPPSASPSTPKPVQLPKGSDVPGTVLVPLAHIENSNVSQGASGGARPKTGKASGKLGESAAKWAQAAEFVPGRVYHGKGPGSYSGATQTGLPKLPSEMEQLHLSGDKGSVCPFYLKGCPYGAENCTYSHGLLCDICNQPVLHPHDRKQNTEHWEECIKKIEEDMENSFNFQRSKDKVCGICMDVVFEKESKTDQRFGILENCNHVFCLNCIRKWRCAKQFERKVVRACPECRVKSDFVTPSPHWVEENGDKQKLIEGYKKALSKKPCNHFKQGKGDCPFNEKCFYLHAYPDGRIASPRLQRRRRKQNADGDILDFDALSLWAFLEGRSTLEMLLDDADIFDHFLFDSSWYSSDDEELISGFVLDDFTDSDSDSYFFL